MEITGGRVRSLFDPFLFHAGRLSEVSGRLHRTEGVAMPRTASIKVIVVILLIGIASPFLG